MSITINIEENSNLAQIKYKQQHGYNSKTLPLKKLVELFTSLTSAKKDTGYIYSNLLREKIDNTTIRLYHFPLIETEFKFTYPRLSEFKNNNKYGVKFLDGTFIFPGFKIRDTIAYTENNSNSSFNILKYNIYQKVPDLIDKIDNATKISKMFPNQFGNSICWDNDFNKALLNNSDPCLQSKFVSYYFSSKFNLDLAPDCFEIHKDNLQDEEFKEFLLEFFYDTDLHYSVLNIFYYYFYSNIKNLNPASLTVESSQCSISTLFQE